MWDDQLDKKLREAADQLHPSPDAGAWKKMEQLLDENLPRKKSRKWLLFFLSMFLLGAGLLWFIREPVSHNDIPGDKPLTRTMDARSNHNFHATSPDTTADVSTKAAGDRQKPAEVVPALQQSPRLPVPAAAPENTYQAADPMTVAAGKKEAPGNDGQYLNNGSTIGEDGRGVAQERTPVQTTTVSTTPVAASQSADARPKAVALGGTSSDTTVRPGGNTSKAAQAFASRFGLWVSAGPGVSYVNGTRGKATLALGGGVAYHFWRHLTLQSGVIIAKKIYSVNGSAYNYSGGSGYNYLQKVSADCKVIDIPLDLEYVLGQKRSHAWVVLAGLSSYLMKKEDYIYLFKTPAGQYYNKQQSYVNQNRHFLSVLSLSAGYLQQFGDRFSLGAQPYIDVPLTGIGAGKVKLKSAGVFLTLQTLPFLRKSK